MADEHSRRNTFSRKLWLSSDVLQQHNHSGCQRIFLVWIIHAGSRWWQYHPLLHLLPPPPPTAPPPMWCCFVSSSCFYPSFCFWRFCPVWVRSPPSYLDKQPLNENWQECRRLPGLTRVKQHSGHSPKITPIGLDIASVPREMRMCQNNNKWCQTGGCLMSLRLLHEPHHTCNFPR